MKEFLKEGLDKFVIPVVVGSIVGCLPFLYSQLYLSRSEENSLIKTAIEELTSQDPLRIDLALLLLQEGLSPERYAKYERIYQNHLRKIVNKEWSAGKVNRSDELISFKELRPEWKRTIDDRIQEIREEGMRKLKEAPFTSENKDLSSDFSNLIQLGTEFLEKGDCLGAWDVFRKAQRIGENQEIAKLGLTIAKNCLPPTPSP